MRGASRFELNDELMTNQEFLYAIERVAICAIQQMLAQKIGIGGDGLILDHLPQSPKTLIKGVLWTLDAPRNRHEVEMKLTHKAHDAWRRGAFDEIAPSEGDLDRFEYDPESLTLRIHLKARGA